MGCSHSSPRCRHSGVDIAILRGQGKGASQTTEGGLRGREEVVVTRVTHLEAGWSVRESVDTRSHKGV